jgi:hypothetical protein
VVGNNVDRERCAFKIVSPAVNSFEDGKEFLVMSVIV